jgi:hypothetical protein
MWDRRIVLTVSLAAVCLAALAVMGWLMLARPSPRKGANVSLSGTTGIPEARILQFYATQSLIGRGAGTSLCYGVEKAASVRMDPEVPAKLDPVAFRCVTVQPDNTTQYELTATDKAGREVSQTVWVTVQ